MKKIDNKIKLEKKIYSSKEKIVIMKFGGTSVGSGEKIQHVANVICTNANGSRCVVVVSAMQGVTDELISLYQECKKGNIKQALHLLEEIFSRHYKTLETLQLPAKIHKQTEKTFGSLFESLRSYLLSKKRFKQEDFDYIVSFGEQLSSRLLSAALQKKGKYSYAIDSTDVLVVTKAFNNAKALLSKTKAKSRNKLLPLLQEGVLPVVTGFFGQTTCGRVAVLGRGGSDYTATILAHSLSANEVILWKEVDGIYSCDPHKEKDAVFFHELTYHEALELAQNGAKVLHPEAMKPVLQKEIPVIVKNTFNPDFSGTKIWKGAL